MKNDSMDNALDRLMRSKGFYSSRLAFNDGFDRNYRNEDNPKIHVRTRVEACTCNPTDDTNRTIECSCLLNTEEHQDHNFPEHPLDIKGALGHIAYDIGPYARKKLKK